MIYGDHELTATTLPFGPIAYLIATDDFPQSAVYKQTFGNHNLTTANFTKPTSYMLTRFKPDNLMHVIHDDILPLLAVLDKLYGAHTGPLPVRLVFADDYGVMPYDELYQNISTFPLLYSSDGCYEKLIFGSDRSTLWYQYGFRQPQGPVPHSKRSIATEITKFKGIFFNQSSASELITILSRKETRVILNEDVLSIRLAKKFSSRVKSIDLETHSLSEIIDVISRSSVVISMHGALLSSIIFMPANSTVLELYPYAVNPDNYTPYKTLASILDINYISWVNRHEDMTVGHADYPPHLGGLLHLSADKQEEIINQTQVPPHLCCEDESWLYHIYQDTIVNVEEILSLLEQVSALQRRS